MPSKEDNQSSAYMSSELRSTYIDSTLAVDVVHLDPFPVSGRGDPVQVGVVDRELGVVLVQNPGSGSLDRHLADGEALRLPVRRSDDLDVELGLPVPELEQDHRQVVDKEQSIDLEQMNNDPIALVAPRD